MVHVEGKATPIRYDDAGRTMSFGETAIKYTSDGLPSKISDPRSGRTEIDRDPNGKVVSE